MALPKEPRQKMINVMYLVLTAILALNVSAEVINAFRTVNKSLMNSTNNISAANETIYKSLEEKLKDPKTAAQAQKWEPLALKAKAYAADLNSYIDGLKSDLEKESGLRMIDKNGVQVKDFKEDNLDASTRLFENKKKGEELQRKLKEYRDNLLNIDPEIRQAFETSLSVEDPMKPIKGQEGKNQDFTTTYFHMTPTIASLTLLSKFQNSVKNAENQVVTFAHSKIGEVAVHMDAVGVLVGQSSNYLMPGQELVVTAGVGAYSSTTKTNLTVNGSAINMVGGQGEYKTTVSGAGKHTLQVSGTFIGENGQPVPVSKTIEYTVGTPGGAAVMLDKMNVFYIGVDNPVTIGSSTGWDRTNVTMSGGSISGSGSQRIVRVSSPGTASITVTADGKSSSFPFRVKMVPLPVFKVGDGRPRMQSVQFKGQQFVRAELENFEFDLKYNVVSATVYFFGAGFPSTAIGSISSNSLAPLASYIAKCQPGTSIAFDNIKVSGPGGTRSIDGRTIQLY